MFDGKATKKQICHHGGTYEEDTNTCTCKTGYDGTKDPTCNTLEDGYVMFDGKATKKQICHHGGTYEEDTNTCTCKTGYDGAKDPTCNTLEDGYVMMPGRSIPTQCNAAGSDPSSSKGGTCSCKTGYMVTTEDPSCNILQEGYVMFDGKATVQDGYVMMPGQSTPTQCHPTGSDRSASKGGKCSCNTGFMVTKKNPSCSYVQDRYFFDTGGTLTYCKNGWESDPFLYSRCLLNKESHGFRSVNSQFNYN